MAGEEQARSDEWRGPGFNAAEAYIDAHDSGMYTPPDQGDGVSFPKDSVGSGPIGDAYVERGSKKSSRIQTARTANASLKDNTTGNTTGLWIRDFQADFGLSGSDAQSKYKSDFMPRFLAQPSFKITAQCFNQEQHLRITKFIRQGMIRQLATGTTLNDLFELRIEDRTYLNKYRRTTRGGYKGHTLRGYVQSVSTGSERFVNAPNVEFVFVLANATDGILASLDGLVEQSEISSYVQGFTAGRKSTPNPDLDLPTAFNDKPVKKPTKKPKASPSPDSTENIAAQLGDIAGTAWSWLMDG